MVGLTLPTIVSGDPVPLMILEAYSGSIKRVCRSTLAAETNAFLSAVEGADYLRTLLFKMKNPGVKLIDLDKHYSKCLLFALTDAKSLEATMNRDAGQPTDKRVKTGEPLLNVLSTGLWQLTPSEEAQAKKQQIREGRKRRKAEKKQSASAEDGFESTSIQ